MRCAREACRQPAEVHKDAAYEHAAERVVLSRERRTYAPLAECFSGSDGRRAAAPSFVCRLPARLRLPMFTMLMRYAMPPRRATSAPRLMRYRRRCLPPRRRHSPPRCRSILLRPSDRPDADRLRHVFRDVTRRRHEQRHSQAGRKRAPPFFSPSFASAIPAHYIS